MKCPICTGVDLIMSDKQGIEIDYCPQCRGIWLDRGELDKIIERSNVQTAAPSYQANYGRENTQRYEEKSHHDSHNKYNSHDDHNGYYKKKKSFLGEIFDF